MSQQVPRFVCTLLSLPAFFLLCGCRDSSMAEVKGKVTYDGQAIEKGAISFYPVDGKSKTTGGEISNGLYSVQVPVGQMKVHISMPKVVGQKKLYNTPNSPSHPVTAEALPAKYNEKSELRIDVTSGTNEKDWLLTSK